MSSVEPENETFWPSVVKHWNQALQNVRMLQKELFEVQTERDEYRRQAQISEKSNTGASKALEIDSIDLEDKTFWFSVVKRWDQALDDVKTLEKQLSELQDERVELPHVERGQSRAPISSTISMPSPRHKKADSMTRLEVTGALDKARQEYTKFQNEIRARDEENTRLKKEILQIEAKNAELINERDMKAEKIELSLASSDDTSSMAEVHDLRQRNSVLESENSRLVTNLKDAGSSVEKLKTLIRSQKTEMEELRTSLNKSHTDVEQLEQDLENAQDALAKASEVHRGFLQSVGQLRNSVHSIHHAQKSSNRSSVGTDLAAAASASTRHAPVPAQHPVASTSSAQIKPVDVKPDIAQSFDDEEVVFVDDEQLHAGSPYVTPVPEHRLKVFGKLPQVIPDISIDQTKSATFTRTFLATHLGGSMQPLIVRVTNSQTELSASRGITDFLCPNLDMNPWCPSRPGEHGYMFVGLGQEKDTFLEEKTYNLFVGAKEKSKSSRLFTYMGSYSAKRVEPLSVQEWESLAPEVRHAYAKTTVKKTTTSRSVEEISSDYDHGRLAVPCVRLQCINFDEVLYEHLVSANINGASDTSSISRTSVKRRRGDQDEGRKTSSRRARQS